MIVNERIKRMESCDYKRGYKDRMAGYYDKWYRYNHKDDGAEYDRGCLDATLDVNCPDECIIIPYNFI